MHCFRYTTHTNTHTHTHTVQMKIYDVPAVLIFHAGGPLAKKKKKNFYKMSFRGVIMEKIKIEKYCSNIRMNEDP